MLGIALRYGVSLDELKLANPKVDPRIMSVGTVLVIPLESLIATLEPSPTPVPLKTDDVHCFRTLEGGMWCAFLVHNDQDVTYESLSAWIRLFAPDGTLLAEKTTSALLNLLKPGESAALAADFPGPLPDEIFSQARLNSALPANLDAGRYLDVSLQNELVEIGIDGKRVRLSGEISWPGQPAPHSIVLAAIALDSSGQVAGLRKMEILSPCGESIAGDTTPTPGPTAQPGCTTVPFEIFIYSQGPAIEQVLPLLEARP